MSDVDEVLRKRLENLRSDCPSSSKASTSGVLPKTQKKSAPEQVEDLLAQLSGESSLETKETVRGFDIDSHLRSRLERLKSREGCEFLDSKSCQIPTSSSHDELADDEFFKSSSWSKLLADLEIGDDERFSDDSSDSETLCGVCDEKKPSFICIDCDKDYYCYKCFKEYHSDDEEHKTVPYAKKS